MGSAGVQSTLATNKQRSIILRLGYSGRVAGGARPRKEIQ